jgi:predicted RNA binding protein YcfA (HicA-like mRNA interferase family)
LKRRDLERHLREHGAQLLREGGSHSFWGFDAERSTAVPRHREIDFRLAKEDLRRPRHSAPDGFTMMGRLAKR